ncbi:hypothetical protein PV04_00584 [Phialophora macrospora]|uniref:Uncharacterized protein n=1 Tax=Phialophora macrospora TaxID=1851006 RepID=A0A0D2EDL0_9EURO|nr:hypothetical protein PV04_00584 [Phialophora macrospora]
MTSCVRLMQYSWRSPPLEGSQDSQTPCERARRSMAALGLARRIHSCMNAGSMHESMRWHLRFSSTTLLQESRVIPYTPPQFAALPVRVAELADTNIPWSFEHIPNQYDDILSPQFHRFNLDTRLRPDTFSLISELTQTCETPPPVPHPVQWIGSLYGPFISTCINRTILASLYHQSIPTTFYVRSRRNGSSRLPWSITYLG